MSESSYKTELREMREKLSGKIVRYERKVEKGENVASLHEELLVEVAQWWGEPAAEYFDRKGALPMVKNQAVPWPIDHSTDFMVNLARLLSGFFAFCGVFACTPALGAIWRLGLAAVAGVLVSMFIFPFIVRLFPPKDVFKRRNNFAEYQSIGAQIAKAREKEAEMQNEEAAEARRQRRLKNQ